MFDSNRMGRQNSAFTSLQREAALFPPHKGKKKRYVNKAKGPGAFPACYTELTH